MAVSTHRLLLILCLALVENIVSLLLCWVRVVWVVEHVLYARQYLQESVKLINQRDTLKTSDSKSGAIRGHLLDSNGRLPTFFC